MKAHPAFSSQAVEDVFDRTPKPIRNGMHRLRDLIYAEANSPVSETLKWGQPSFAVQGGSPLRIAPTKDGGFALYTICQTSLIPDFAETFPGMDKIEGTRAILFEDEDQIDPGRHSLLIRHALTYHKKRST